MDRVFIKNLVLNGIHGLTEKEKNESQRFEIDITLWTKNKFYLTDSIGDTLDYRIARRIAEQVIEKKSFNLIETLANNIAQEILENTGAGSIEVSIRKTEIWRNGIPGVTIIRRKIPPHLNLLDFDIEKVIEVLAAEGGISFPILPNDRRTELLKEATLYQYQEQPEIVGKAKVQEQLSSFSDFPSNSLFYKLRNDFLELLIRKLATLEIKNVFTTPVNFNKTSLQKYEKGSIGITPHLDGKSIVNLICIFILTGKAEFALCDDRLGSNSKFLNVIPGNVIILRGPGFFRSTFRPFHFVRNITEERIIFGLRQKQAA